MGASETPRILEATRFAAERHARQRRKDSEATPYVNHVIEVAALVAEVVGDGDPNLVIAALLHDTIEDVDVSREEIAERFGEDVAELVWLVTDDKSLPKAERKRLQVERAPFKPRRAQILKTADKISNLRAILDSPPAEWSEERRRDYVRWARAVVGGFSEPEMFLIQEFERLARALEEKYGA